MGIVLIAFLLGVYVGGVAPMLALGALTVHRGTPPVLAVYYAVTWPAVLCRWLARGPQS